MYLESGEEGRLQIDSDLCSGCAFCVQWCDNIRPVGRVRGRNDSGEGEGLLQKSSCPPPGPLPTSRRVARAYHPRLKAGMPAPHDDKALKQ